MMIERHQHKKQIWIRRCWQAAFALLLCGVVTLETAPLLSEAFAKAGDEAEQSAVEAIAAERILLADSGKTGDAALVPGKKVVIRQNDNERYATSREDESVSELLVREGVSVGALDMVRVDLSGEDIVLEIASDFTYYETVSETAAYATVFNTDYTIPKGEQRVTQEGRNGVKAVTYEVVYADGAFLSRQAVAEEAGNAVDEVISTGTLVTEAQEGDTIASVITNDDGSGYLIMKSGDSLHFTGSKSVKCTAYTANIGKVGTITATGTKVHTGVVAVDRSVIPLGTRMFIATANGDYTYGMAHAEDTGVVGNVVDLYMNSYNECIQFGRRSSTVYFLDP